MEGSFPIPIKSKQTIMFTHMNFHCRLHAMALPLMRAFFLVIKGGKRYNENR